MITSVKVIGKIEIKERLNPKAIIYTKCFECGKTIAVNTLNHWIKECIINGKLLKRVICNDCHNSGGEFDDLTITVKNGVADTTYWYKR